MHAEFATLHSLTSEAAAKLATDADPIPALTSLLLSAHTQAAVLGRTHAGDDGEEDELDREFAQEVMDEEADFLANFADDVASGRYTDDEGEPRTAAIQARMQLYVDKLVATANEAMAFTCTPTTLFYWQLGGTEDHCEDCPSHASHGPYTHDSLPAIPCDGSTACLTRCLCTLQTSTGLTGFTRPTNTEG